VLEKQAVPQTAFAYIGRSHPLQRRFKRIMAAKSIRTPKFAVAGMLMFMALGLVLLPGVEPRAVARNAAVSTNTAPHQTPADLLPGEHHRRGLLQTDDQESSNQSISRSNAPQGSTSAPVEGQSGLSHSDYLNSSDKSLYETGMDYLKKSQYIKSRLAFQTLIETYPDSAMAAEARMAIGDSFYREGGTENLLQAQEQYKAFIISWPTHAKAAEAQLKVVSLNMRMMRSRDSDLQYSASSEREIKKFLNTFPDSDFAPIVREYLRDARENLAHGDFTVAQFHADRGIYAGAMSRLKEFFNSFRDFSRIDEV
jgi:outer membrane protein assembly factor BamD